MAHGRTKNVTHPSGSAFWNILVLIMTEKKITNSKPIPHIPLPFKEAIADVLKVKPPEKTKAKRARPKET